MKFRFFQGLKEPSVFLESWKTVESYTNIRSRIVALFLISSVIFGAAGWIGMGSQTWSGQFVTAYGLEYDLQRFYFFLGRILLGILSIAVLLLLPALLYWLLAEEHSYRKIVAIQIFPISILLLEQLLFVLLMVWQGIDWHSSPFSLGVIGQLVIEHEWTIYFLGSISLFKIWVMYWQFLTLRIVTTLKWWVVFVIIFAMNILFWAITATFATLNFHQYLYS